MVGLALVVSLLAPAAPVPAAPPVTPLTPADQTQSLNFAQMVYNTAQNVRTMRPDVETRDLIAGAVRGLYEEAGQKVPDDVLKAVAQASNVQLIGTLAEARMKLGTVPALAGARSLFAAINGFRHATDPYCGLVSPRVNTFVSIDMDFGLGLELDGVGGPRWSIYRIERGVASGTFPATGIFGALPKPDAVPSPANFPWRIKRIIPGGPAQRAGVKPGDVITHLDGDEVTPESANRLFTRFAYPSGVGFDPNTGQPLPMKRKLTFRRAGQTEPIVHTLETQHYTPEAVFGVMRTQDGKWDCLLDRERKIGYIRVGPIEERSDERLGEMLDGLAAQNCRALILDLRWCPGGYVTPGTRMAGMFLKPNDLVAEVRTFSQPMREAFPPSPTTYRAPAAPIGGKFRNVPVLLLVGSETTGGGELIAAALIDNDDTEKPMIAVMGQRTVGRASIQNTIQAGFADLQFKVTTGSTLRPNGKPRGKQPDSKPTDDWGIRPDTGLEVPITADLSAKLRQWAEEHGLRPAGSREALTFDDPMKDPYRSAALIYLRRKLEK